MDTTKLEDSANKMINEGATAASLNQIAAQVNEAIVRCDDGGQVARLNSLHSKLKTAAAYAQHEDND